MGITFTHKAAAPTAVSPANTTALADVTPTQKKRRGGGGVKPKAPLIDLNQPGRLRVANLMALYNLASANTLYTRLHLGKIPPPDGRDGKSPYWLTSTIRAHLEGQK
ncbi:hypothetical protein PTE30175_03540 [Pandoraea terrae]|uniref:Uncharacterized protein n=1 Tax=Pandoraea terrae TaxID=1537710 RepID=A0A5E4X361_9BURK|nr:hypothetical protein [Pandoraea terrae]VVE30724.1 hypothetical protein PTE30175_03540 [Pandoraea terrae]